VTVGDPGLVAVGLDESGRWGCGGVGSDDGRLMAGSYRQAMQ
jgi:hypothetical protein